MGVLNDIAKGYQQFYYNLYPEKKAALDESDYRRKMMALNVDAAQRREVEDIRRQKEQDDHRKAVDAYRKMELGEMAGRDDLFSQGESELAQVFPGYSMKDGVLNTPEGQVKPPMDRKSRRDRLMAARSYVDVDKFVQERTEARKALDDKNRELRGSPVELANGKFAYAQIDDNGVASYFDNETNKPIAGIPQTLSNKWAKEKHTQEQRKSEEDILSSRSNRSLNEAQIGEIGERTKKIKQERESGTFSFYISNGSDGFQPGTLIRKNNKTGDLSPKEKPKTLSDAYKMINENFGVYLGSKKVGSEMKEHTPVSRNDASRIREFLRSMGFDAEWDPTKDYDATDNDNWVLKRVVKGHLTKQSKQITADIARDYLIKAGGDKNKARQMAKAYGYTF